MFGDIGAPELIIILLIVIVLFGAGRVGKLGKDIGTSVKEFRKAVKDEDEEAAAKNALSATSTAPADPKPAAPAPQETSSTAGQKPPSLF